MPTHVARQATGKRFDGGRRQLVEPHLGIAHEQTGAAPCREVELLRRQVRDLGVHLLHGDGRPGADPADAEIDSHRLLLRAGCIRRVASGVYAWLPLGQRVLAKVEQIVREEMDAAGAQEVTLPIAQPIELWQQSGRDELYGPLMFRLHDRKDAGFFGRRNQLRLLSQLSGLVDIEIRHPFLDREVGVGADR